MPPSSALRSEATAPEPARAATWLVDQLAALGLRHVFTLPGLQIDPLNRALGGCASLQAVVANHELAAGYMADGYARARGGPAAVFAIGGPGCANLVGAAIAAHADRSPVLFVTGNVPAAARQPGAFQDGGPQGANDVAVMAAALGGASLDARAAGWPAALERLRSGLPAHLQLSHDEQLAPAPAAWTTPRCDPPVPQAHAQREAPSDGPDDACLTGRTLLFIDGQALDIADAVAEAAARFMLPVATTLAARGVIDESAPWSTGHLGFVPHPRAQALLAHGTPLAADRVLHIGGDAQWTQRLRTCHPQVQVVAPPRFVRWLQDAPRAPTDAQRVLRREWLQAGAAVDRTWPRPTAAHAAPTGLTHAAVIDALVRQQPPDSAWVVDAGQVRRVAVARLRCRRPRSLFVAEGMAPMGWSLGAAVGVALAQPGRPVVALLGDGAMRMHGIEIATAARYRLPIVYVLFDNQAYGSVLQRMASAAEVAQARLPAVDWLAFARAFGVPGLRADDAANLHAALANPRAADQPLLIVARVPAIDAEAFSQPSGIDWPQTDGAAAEA